MTHQLPTGDDISALVAYVASQPHMQGDAQAQLEITVPLRSVLTLIIEDVGISASFFHSPEGPMVDPRRFFADKQPQLQELFRRSLQHQAVLEAEGREHGLNFAPEAIKAKYLCFLDSARSIESWTKTTMELLHQPPAAESGGNLTAESHDVLAIFLSFKEQSQLFFLGECTVFDPRIQRRMLMPCYFVTLRDLTKELFKEIERLRGIEQVYSRSGKRCVFNPSITEFVFLFESLQIYLSSSIIEDELTTLTYFRIMYDSMQKQSKNIAELLSGLPKPLPPHLRGQLPQSAGEINPSTIGPDGLSEEQRDAIRTALASFDEIRSKTMEFKANMSRDIEQKDKSHRTRVPQGKRPQQSATTTQPPVAPVESPKGFWGSLTTISSRLLKGAADVVTCKAEIFPAGSAEMDVDGTPLAAHSPLYEPKMQLFLLVEELVQCLEEMADGLERQYEGLYHRDWKSKVAKSAGKVMDALESMTVVFGK